MCIHSHWISWNARAPNGINLVVFLSDAGKTSNRCAHHMRILKIKFNRAKNSSTL